MKLGIGSFTYSWAMGIPNYDHARPRITCADIIDRAAAKGCDVVQLCDNAFLEKKTKAEREALAAKADSLAVALQVGTRGVDPENLRLYLAICADMKAGLVRSMFPKEGYGSDLNDGVAMLKEIMPEYEKAGVLLSLENHDRHTCRELVEALDRVASPNLGICLDTANSYGTTEDITRVIEVLLPVSNCVHIKDFVIARISTLMGFSIGGLPAGRGMLDIKRILDNYRGPGDDASVILELWTPYINDLDETIDLEYRWTEQSLEYLRPFFDKPAKM